MKIIISIFEKNNKIWVTKPHPQTIRKMRNKIHSNHRKTIPKRSKSPSTNPLSNAAAPAK